MAKIELSDWNIERLGRHHDRSGFDGGQPKLTEWLKRTAGQHARRGFAQTFVATRVGEANVLGYYAILNHTLEIAAIPPTLAKGLPPIDAPVILLGRLAVDRSLRGQGLGTLLLVDALKRIVQLAEQVGIWAVEVDAIDDSASAFYQRFGFMTLADDPHHLCLPLTVVRELHF